MFSATQASLAGMGGSLSAGNILSDAAERSQGLIKKQFNANEKNLTPYTKGAVNAWNMYGNALGANGEAAQRDYYNNFQYDPGFQTGLNTALDTTMNKYALMGRTGGNVANALLREGQKAMYDQYGNRVNQLANFSNAGRGTQTDIANLGAGSVAQRANIIMQGAQGRAEGVMNAANASAAGFNNNNSWNQFQNGMYSGNTVNRASF